MSVLSCGHGHMVQMWSTSYIFGLLRVSHVFNTARSRSKYMVCMTILLEHPPRKEKIIVFPKVSFIKIPLLAL